MKININDITLDKNYEGYLWLSNSTEPHVYINEKINLHMKEGIFIVEGQLYNSTDYISYSIKYVDGKYIVYKNDIDSALLNLGEGKQKSITMKDEEGNDVLCIVERKDYLSNRMSDHWLKFLRYWEEKEDENCMNMPVLTFTKNVFVGFKK